MRQWVCLNGTLLPAEEARVSVFDSGLMQGIGLFETMRAYDGRVFRLRQHLERLVASAGQLGWSVRPSVEELAGHIDQVVRATAAGDLRVRLTVTTGSLHTSPAGEDSPQLTIIAMASPFDAYAPELYQKGVTAIVSDYRQYGGDPTVGHKTTSYFARLAALRAAHAQSAFEALWFTPDEALAEGCISSAFVVRNDELLTPPADTPVLPGITRAAVLELAEDEGIHTREAELGLDDILASEEMFLTNSMFELVPVVRIGRAAIGNEKVGDMTRRLAIAYGHLIDRELEAEPR